VEWQGDVYLFFIHARARLGAIDAERLKKNLLNRICTVLSGVVDGVWNGWAKGVGVKA
jgi:hypothetical protein